MSVFAPDASSIRQANRCVTEKKNCGGARLNPVRTCVGCRARADKSSLLRVVAHDSVLVADETATLPGRGAYIHATEQCFEKAVKRRAFGRALRTEAHLDHLPLENRLNGSVNN